MSDVIIRKQGHAGRITLNRPDALNALSHEMALEIEKALDVWRDDDAVSLIIIDAVGEKAFCAGGDIQKLYESGKAGDLSYGRTFWRDEYRLNAKIADYPKPYVAIMDGIVMGGGVGISAHGSHRIVTERSMVAMPEVGIGFLPDVGGTYLLSRSPKRVGEYLGLTGTRMDAADAIIAGFADAFVPVESQEKLIAALCENGIGEIEKFSKTAPDGTLESKIGLITDVFNEDSVDAIVKTLEEPSSEWGNSVLKLLRRVSPLSAVCALYAIRHARTLSTLKECLALEYRFVHRAMEMSDFIEGIRAQVIDKDRNPQWRHGSFDNVTEDNVAAMFALLGDDELIL